jgi:intein/homing endonuclease
MANNQTNLTVWQRLSRTLNGSEAEQMKYIINRELIKDLDPQAYEREKLEAQQTLYLQGMWRKIDNELYQKAVFYEPTRIASYYDFEAMEFSIASKSMIYTLEGFQTIESLAAKGRDYEFITYAYDHNKKQVVPALARNAHYTRDEMTYKIIFDDDTFIIATYGHRFLKRDGVYAKVEDLHVGDSMMPFYQKSFFNNQNYNWIYTCNSKVGHHGWVPEHTLVAEHLIRPLEENEVVHHLDFNGKNNLVENLKIWDEKEHQAFHARHNNEKLWANPEYRTKMLEVGKRTDNKHHWNGARIGVNNPAYFHIPWDNIVEAAQLHKTLFGTAKALNISHTKLQRELQNNGYNDWVTFLVAYGIEKSKYSTAIAQSENRVINHKIKAIEPFGVVPVYDLTVPGYKNFATDTIFSHNTPEIGAALDLYMEESCTANENGTILQIYSESNRIKSALEELFFDVLDISSNLPPWTRNICKYGDNFVYLKVLPKKGVVGCKQLPNIEITRVEPDFQKITSLNDLNREPNVKFFWKNKDMEFNTFEMAHFRLLGDDRRLPYGTCLKSDSYINTNKGYKEIKDVQIGDMVLSFNTAAQETEYSKVLDVVRSGKKQTYKISSKHYFVDASEEHKIMIYDKKSGAFDYKNVLDLKINDLLVTNTSHNINQEITIDKTLPDDYEKSLTYSKNNHYWDNIDLIPDVVTPEFAELFGYLVGDGSLDKNSVSIAQGIHKEINKKYASLLEKFSGHQVTTLPEEFGENARSNSKLLVTILQRMGFTGNAHTKRIPSWVYTSSIEIKEAFINGLFQADGSIFIDKWNCCRYQLELSNEMLIKDVKILLQSLGYKTGKISKRQRKDVIINGIKIQHALPSYGVYYYLKKNKQAKTHDISNRLTDQFILEPIISIEKSDFADTYDIYVEHPEHNFIANNIVVHNSMLDKARRIWKQLVMSEDAMLTYRISRAAERRVYKVFVGNMDDKDVDAYIDKVANNFRRSPVVDSANANIDLRYNMISVDQDIFVPLRDPTLPTPIEILPGAQNLDAIADIKYIQNKLLTALRIPRPFIGFDETAGEGKNLAMMDVRFARTVYRIQKALIQELNKIAIIHLYLKGFEDELGNFTLTLTNPSTQQDLLKIERWREKVLLYRDAVTAAEGGFAAMSATKAKKDILDMSDDEIKLDIQRQAVEMAAVEEKKMLAETIKQTGVFKDLYDIYNIDPSKMVLPGQNQQGGTGGIGGTGGAGGIGGGLMSEPTPPGGEGGEGGEAGSTSGSTENNPATEEPEELAPEEATNEPLKEQFFQNEVNVRLESKRLSQRLEKRNATINEEVYKMMTELDTLTDKKTDDD